MIICITHILNRLNPWFFKCKNFFLFFWCVIRIKAHKILGSVSPFRLGILLSHALGSQSFRTTFRSLSFWATLQAHNPFEPRFARYPFEPRFRLKILSSHVSIAILLSHASGSQSFRATFRSLSLPKTLHARYSH